MTRAEPEFENVQVVLADRVVRASLGVTDGLIQAIDVHETIEEAVVTGEFVLPGLVELHTDHLEGHYAPRPGVRWNALASVQAHDAQVASSGITTVFDALRIGMDEESRLGSGDMRILADAIAAAQSQGRLKAEHFLHLRCEVSGESAMAGYALFAGDPMVRMASLMDHTPGQRQFASLQSYLAYYKDKTAMSEADLAGFVQGRRRRADHWSERNRRDLSQRFRAAGVVLASHDDATRAHVDEAVAMGISIAEFPTTMEAARGSREAGLKVLMGAPNAVRGGSHSGNLSARALAEQGLLDLLSSDYVPFSLLHAAFLLARDVEAMTLPEAVRMVTLSPAEAAGLTDRGVIALGKRADLVRACFEGEVPLVRGVWRAGRRVA